MGNLAPELYERVERCCCKMCGSPIKPQVIVYDRYGGHGIELYCETCQRIEYGTEPDIYALAKDFVDSFEFNYFPDMEENKYCEQLNVAKICEMFSWVLGELHLLDEHGIDKEKWSYLKNEL